MADFVLSEAEVEDNVCNDMSVVSEERENHRVSTTFLEIITMQLMILCLVLIFFKKGLIIILIMKLKKR